MLPPEMNTPSPTVIQVKEIRRSFRSIQKSAGFGGAFRLLVKPTYQEKEAVKGVSFEVEAGAFIGLIGANGAGKTTVLKILSGLIPPSQGEARVLGFEPFKRSLEFRKKISLVMGQKAQLWWDLPGIDAFDLIRAIYEIPLPIYKERLAQLAALLDVEKLLQTQIRRLSLGERMKMELIGAILHWPKVLFLDEPTIGLDVLAAHKLREFLKYFNETNQATIILTSHNMDDIEKLCSRVLIMRAGELVYDGSPQGLTEEGSRRLRVRLFERPTLEELIQATGLPASVIDLSQAGPEAGAKEDNDLEENRAIRLSIQQDRIVPVLQSLMARYKVIDMGIEEQSLEDVIQRLFASNEITP